MAELPAVELPSVVPVRLAVCGSTGADRHYICNAILGEELLHESKDIIKVVSRSDEINQIFIEVTSIASFDDSIHSVELYKNAQLEIRDKEFDLFLFCIPAKTARPNLEVDKKAYHQLDLHQNAMKNGIVVLTYSDSIVKNSQTRCNTKNVTRSVVKDYKLEVKKWEDSIKEIFEENTPVVPAGSLQSFSILDDNESWLQKLFELIIEKSDDKTCETLIKMNCHRFYSGIFEKEFLTNKKINDHPILVVNSDNSKIIAKVKKVTAGIGAGGAAGAVGATIGATIGALAIGIPSFGVAAGTGLVLGATIGGGIGVGTGVGVSRAVEKYKRKKFDDEGLI